MFSLFQLCQKNVIGSSKKELGSGEGKTVEFVPGRKKKSLFFFIFILYKVHVFLSQEYSCGKAFIKLSDVKTWADVAKSEKIDLADKKFKEISKQLLNDFELNSNIDLSDKVGLLIHCFKKITLICCVRCLCLLETLPSWK
jgi:hypothetical protein